MHLSAVVPLGLAAVAAASSGCSALHRSLPSSVFAKGSSVYNYEAQNFWSNTEIMSPACVFRPQSSGQLAKGLKALVHEEAQFAVRGGGHMGIRGSNNIDGGVLVVMSNLTTLQLNQDKSLVSVGPSHRWSDVYSYLGQFNLTAAGGRLGPVGVPGLLLAGGVNFYGNQVGFSADTVINYEVVLANGSVIEVNKISYPDLFWALKGGSSNFGLVTRFDMQTIPSRKVWAGIHTVAAPYVDRFLQVRSPTLDIFKYPETRLCNLCGQYLRQEKTHVVPALIAGNSTLGSVILFYDSDTIAYPESLKPFTDIPAISSTVGFKTMSEFAAETGEAVTPHINDVFVAGTVTGTNYNELLQGISIINTTFFNELPKLYAQVPAANISIIELDWQPIGADWIKASNARGGNPPRLRRGQGLPLLCGGGGVDWICKAGLYDPFNYMGDAAGFQSIFPGYGAENHQKLVSIAQKYDPTAVFQSLMPGGFKVY
ncbi:6-hydroxy-D-nicotine oxidase [Penicillium chermesinum]|nr:6-hydroxy-D-nicotine oxidase [Penicillium chermesinum]